MADNEPDNDQYGLDLPSDKELTDRFKYLVNYWKNRNSFIKARRDADAGLNKIESPVSTQYTVKVIHTYTLTALMNEKMSRYSQLPTIQVIPDDDLDNEGREKSSRIERAINIGAYEMERISDGDVWNRVIEDAQQLDEGVEKIIASPAAFWTAVVQNDKDGGKDYPMQEDSEGVPTGKREEYKKRQGVPIMKHYVPLENFYPQYDGPNLIEGFDVEERSIRSVLNNPLFIGDNPGSKRLNDFSRSVSRSSGGLSAKVMIVQYIDNNYHAYYLAGKTSSNDYSTWPRQGTLISEFTGELLLLYSYEHGLGESLYNCVGGRYGGWKTSNNRIEGVGKGLLELNQAADEIASQTMTNLRARFWPNLNFKMDPMLRGYGTGGSVPDAPKVKEGEAIVTFTGEEITPIFEGKEEPLAMWLWDTIQGQVGKLGGSSVLFGGRSPGVDTGYHQALQTTQAESLDEKVEQHISAGAIQEATKFLLQCKALGERVWMHYPEQDPLGKRGAKVGKYVYLDPEDLTPLPRMDAQVRKPRPMDYLAALQAAQQASDDRGGKGPLLSDDSIRQDILNIEAPDIEKDKILIESQEREIVASGVLSAKIGERINIKLAKNGTPQVSPEMIQQADPSLLAAIQSGQGPAAAMGGTSPELLGQVATTTGSAGPPAQGAQGGQAPGPAVGNPEPMNRLGEAMQGLQMTGTPSIGG